jgi:hypothetical protein
MPSDLEWAREWLMVFIEDSAWAGSLAVGHVRVLLAATEPVQERELAEAVEATIAELERVIELHVCCFKSSEQRAADWGRTAQARRKQLREQQKAVIHRNAEIKKLEGRVAHFQRRLSEAENACCLHMEHIRGAVPAVSMDEEDVDAIAEAAIESWCGREYAPSMTVAILAARACWEKRRAEKPRFEVGTWVQMLSGYRVRITSEPAWMQWATDCDGGSLCLRVDGLKPIPPSPPVEAPTVAARNCSVDHTLAHEFGARFRQRYAEQLNVPEVADVPDEE